MTRWFFQTIIMILLGVITALLVALASARWSPPSSFAPGFLQVTGDTPDWSVNVYQQSLLQSKESIDARDILTSTERDKAFFALSRRIPRVNQDQSLYDSAYGMVAEGPGVLWMQTTRLQRFDRSFVAAPAGGSKDYSSIIEKQYGWPLLCLSSLDHAMSLTAAAPGEIDWVLVSADLYDRYHWRAPAGADRALDVPRVILWTGFIGNTMIYAALWWAVLIGYANGRRAVRRRRGRCPRCGYHLRGELESGCPECGWGRDDR